MIVFIFKTDMIILDKLLKQVSWIYYQLYFLKKLDDVKTLVDFGSEINIIHPVLIKTTWLTI